MSARIGVVTRVATGTNRTGTEVGRLALAVLSSHEDSQTVELPQGGEEFNPPIGCRLVIVEAGPDCKMAVAVDESVPPAMDPGGKRIYSVDTTGMTVMAEVQLKPDGTVLVQNGAASFTMSPAGVFTLHGTSITADCDVVAAGISLVHHTHPDPQGGSTGEPV